MIRKPVKILLSLGLFFLGTLELVAQKSDTMLIMITVTAKIEDSAQVVQWEQTMEYPTILGKPVSIKLDGDGLKLRALFTPYHSKDDQFLLVAQAQVNLTSGSQNSLQNSFQSLNCQLGQQVLFYPLGMKKDSTEAEGHTLMMEITLSTFKGDLPVMPQDP